jgi:hypothetical protein
MWRILWRLARGYRLRPWRSPYLRWRIETYSGIHAEAITFGGFWKFVWSERRSLLRYLRWAAANTPKKKAGPRKGPARSTCDPVGGPDRKGGGAF